MNILALDFGTTTGFATLVLGRVSSGTWKLEKTAHQGQRFDLFDRIVNSLIQSEPIEHIVYEKPLGRWAKSQAQTDLSIGFKTILELQSFRKGVKLEPVHISTLKKFTTGNGKATKEEMVAAVNTLYSKKLTVKDHDEADALALLQYARRNERLGNDSQFPAWKREKGDPF